MGYQLIQLVAHTNVERNGQSAGSTVTSSAIDTRNATLIVLAYGNNSTNTTVSDSAGNTWTALSTYTDANTAFTSILYYCLNPVTSASHTFSLVGVHFNPTLCVAAFSGVNGLDSGATGNTGYPVTSLQPGSISPSQDSELVISNQVSRSTATDSVNDSFNVTDDVSFTGGGTGCIGETLAYIVQSTATPVNPTWLSGVASYGMASSIAAFTALPLLNPTISVSESSAIGESVVLKVPVSFSISESSAIGESVVLNIPVILPTITESSALGEFVDLEIFSYLPVISDSTAVSENVSVHISENLPVISDSTAIGESVALYIPINVVIAESSAVGELVLLSIPFLFMLAVESTIVVDTISVVNPPIPGIGYVKSQPVATGTVGNL